MHDLLGRQIRAVFGDDAQLSDRLSLFIDIINETYKQNSFKHDAIECLLKNITYELNETALHLDCEKNERLAIESELRYIKNFDDVTGLANRNILNDRIKQYISVSNRYDQSFLVIVVGLDSFRLVNEVLGLNLGDAILKIIANLLTSCVRECDTVAHLIGDEFVLAMSPTEEPRATILVTDEIEGSDKFYAEILQRILDAISQPLVIDGHDLQITCSIGACVYPRDGRDVEELLKHAEAALSTAKQFGRNNYQFYSLTLGKKANEKFSLYGRLRHAIEYNELILHYQPQVNLNTGRVSGVEALIRWNHPELGLLSPIHFIPLAEETGLIIPIGEWVIRTTCLQIKHWQKVGLGNVRVAVNVSARQFLHVNLVQTIKNIIAETGVDPHYLDIELTESHLMIDIDRAIGILSDIKKLGIQLSVDDFGTGYSSLSYLKHLPINVLKIDQSFVRDININVDGNAISKAIISMAHNLGLRVIAEGVETEIQCAFLSQYLCDEIQGYLYSEGLPAQALEKLLYENRKLPPHLLRLSEKQQTLLLVGQTDNTITDIKYLLRHDGYQILGAYNAFDALKILEQNNIDVLLTENKMTGMTGVELLCIVKEKYSNTVCTMLVEHVDIQTLISAVNEGAVFHFLTKPYNDNQLRWHIMEAFKRKQFEDENRRLSLDMQVANHELACLNRELKDVLNYRMNHL